MGATVNPEHLLALARERSAKSRTELAQAVDSLFGDHGSLLSDREKGLMFNIIENLVHEVEVSVRKSLSEKLADISDAPLTLIKTIASDDIEIAYPVLSRSRVLQDSDLIEIIRHRTEEYFLAITLRNDISEGVSDALVETKNENVITSLLKNENASISNATLEYLVTQSKRVDTYQEPLLRRSDLKEGLAKKMYMWVSAALRSHIVGRYDLDITTFDKLLEEAANEGYDNSMAEKSKEASVTSELVKSLRKQDMSPPEMLLKTLSDGEISLFLAIFSDLTKINDLLIKRIVFEKGGEGIAIACKAIGFSNTQFATIYSKSRRVIPGHAEAMRTEINEILELYSSIKRDEAIKVVEMWQRDTEYLAAIRDLLPDV
jgi:uncharacterized protein (DUF2336 family)